MLQSAKIKYIFPIGFFLALFLDGSINLVFSKALFAYPYSMVSNLTILWMILAIFFEGETKLPIATWAAGVGLVFDWYYTGVFGVNMFILPVLVIIVQWVKVFFKPTFLSILLTFFLTLTLYESAFYIVFSLVHYTTVASAEFVAYNLAPTLALNLCFFVLLYLPIKSLFRHTRGANFRSID
ncbi:rod shape-determining protein MreD [Pediococcus cellicola]|nr:rod shape-determining protein MreD [Pediococcus cellicola]GEL15815.1 rod shape-determining protein MreD [Pediococcus cellicola]